MALHGQLHNVDRTHGDTEMPSPVIRGLEGAVEYPLLAAADLGKAPELHSCPWASGYLPELDRNRSQEQEMAGLQNSSERVTIIILATNAAWGVISEVSHPEQTQSICRFSPCSSSKHEAQLFYSPFASALALLNSRFDPKL